MSIFPGLAALLDGALASVQATEAATLTKYTIGTRTALDPLSGTNPTSVAYVCRGFVAARTTGNRPADMTTAVGDRSVCLMAASLPSGIEPLPGDRIAIDGAVYMVSTVSRDPAGACWVAACRGV